MPCTKPEPPHVLIHLRLCSPANNKLFLFMYFKMIVQFPLLGLIGSRAKISVVSPFISGTRCRVKLLSYSIACDRTYVDLVPELFRWDFEGFTLETAAVVDGVYSYCSHGLIVAGPDKTFPTIMVTAHPAFEWTTQILSSTLSADFMLAVDSPGTATDPLITSAFLNGHITFDFQKLD